MQQQYYESRGSNAGRCVWSRGRQAEYIHVIPSPRTLMSALQISRECSSTRERSDVETQSFIAVGWGRYWSDMELLLGPRHSEFRRSALCMRDDRSIIPPHVSLGLFSVCVHAVHSHFIFGWLVWIRSIKPACIAFIPHGRYVWELYLLSGIGGLPGFFETCLRQWAVTAYRYNVVVVPI